MKTASPALNSFLDSDLPFIGADLFVITLASTVAVSGAPVQLFLTSLDRNVIYTGTNPNNPDFGTNTYHSMGQNGLGSNFPIIQRSKVSVQVGLSPTTVELELYSLPSITLCGLPLLTTIAQGYWNNAQVWVRRAWLLPVTYNYSSGIWSTSGTPNYGPDVNAGDWNQVCTSNLGGAGDGTLIWFFGVVGKVTELGPTNAKFEVRDPLWLLNRPLPKNLWSPGCYHTLYDKGCALNQAVWRFSGTIPSGSSTTAVLITQNQDQNPPNAPVFGSNPIVDKGATNYTLDAVTYWVVVTYVTAFGETVASAEWSLGVDPNHYIWVTSPPSVAGVTYWNCYVGTEQGDEQLQQATIPIGTPWEEDPSIGVYLTGVYPSPFATNGYFSLGVLSVTYNSGPFLGQTYSAFIETSTWNGTHTICTLRIPLPAAPTAGDSYVVYPGCDKRKTTCGGNPVVAGGGVIQYAINGSTTDFVIIGGLYNSQTLFLSGFSGSWAACNGSFSATVIGSAGTEFSIPVNSTSFGVMTGNPVWSTIAPISGSSPVGAGKFGNLLNHGGQAFIPVPETGV